MKNLLLLSILMFCNTITSAQNSSLADYYAKYEQKIIDKINPVFAKIQTQTKEGWREEIILKTDSARIANIEKFTEGYFLYDSEIVLIDTVYTRWNKRLCRENENCHCCFSTDPNDCLIWVMVEGKVDITEAINIYRPIEEFDAFSSENDNTENPSTETSNINLISAFPNPFRDNLTVKAKVKIINISITDISGKIVFQQNANQNELVLDLQHLAKGNYVLSVETVVGNEVIKLVR